MNSNFKSLGWQDTELAVRSSILELKSKMISDVLFHLEHKRPSESLQEKKGTKTYNDNNRNECNKIRSMSKHNLLKYVKIWKNFG